MENPQHCVCIIHEDQGSFNGDLFNTFTDSCSAMTWSSEGAFLSGSETKKVRVLHEELVAQQEIQSPSSAMHTLTHKHAFLDSKLP